MAGKTVTRAELSEAVYQKVGLSRNEAAKLVAGVLEGVCATLASGESVKLYGFGQKQDSTPPTPSL
jgi:integration host factor subunit alpha